MSTPPIVIHFRRLHPDAALPRRASEHASGLDLVACLPQDGSLTLGPDPVLVPTGLAMEMPAGYDAEVRPRSGLARRGVLVAHGTIDADYRGELLVTMYTIGSTGNFTIHHGDRIAQLVISRLADVEAHEKEELSDTVRGARGHGSTGMR